MIMLRGFLYTLVFCGVSSAAVGEDIDAITSCAKQVGGWRCAEWQAGKINVFDSHTNQSRLSFSEPTPSIAQGPLLSKPKPDIHNDSVTRAQEVPSPNNSLTSTKASTAKATPQVLASSSRKYTLQLFACKTISCLQQMEEMGSIPDSRTTDIKIQGDLWRVLLVGEFHSKQAAQRAKQQLKAQFSLREEPWIRTIYY